MIISHKYRFIFIKTYKTAGTSLEVYLSGVCGENDVVTPVFPEVEGHVPRNWCGFYNHMSANEVKNNVGEEIWKNYYKFCVERNPWEKFISFYWMEKSRRDKALSIDDFMLEEKIGYSWPLYADPATNKPMVDEIIRYENLNEDLGKLFSKLGIPWTEYLTVTAKGEYRQDKSSFEKQLTREQIDYLSLRFESEIEWFGYGKK